MSHGVEEGVVVSSSSLVLVWASWQCVSLWALSPDSASVSGGRCCIGVVALVMRRGMRTIIRSICR
eukprot:5203541-Pyramimonas_sp.AAC.1